MDQQNQKKKPSGLLHSPARRYAAAVVFVAAAAAVRLAFMGTLGSRAAYVTFYPAVMLAALLGGLPAGLLATALSALLATYFWIEPVGFRISHPADWLGMAVFLFSCTMISVITGAMRRARARAQAAEAEVRLAAERQKAAEALREEKGHIELLAESARMLLSTDTPERIVQTLAEKVMRYLNCHAFFNYLIENDKRRMHLNAWHGIPDSTAKDIEYLDFGVAICGCVARDEYRIIAEDIQNTDDERAALVRSFGIQCYACHPLVYQGKTIGTLSFGACDRKSFTEKELDLMKTVADQVAAAMARKRVEDALRKHQESLEEQVRERTAELTEQSRMMEAFLRHSAAPLVFLDRDFNFIRVNEAYARVCAREVPDFAGRNHFVDYPSDELKEEFERVVRTKEPYSVFTRPFVFPEHPEWGTTYWDLFLYPILDDRGEVDFLVFSLNEVTERKRAEDEALRMQKLDSLRVLAGGIAHDLNNMMVAVEANAGLALKALDDSSAACEYLTCIEKAADKVSAFSKQILSFTGKAEETREPVRLNDVISDTARLLMASISKKAVLECSLPDDVPAIMANPQNMQQVVMNLIINASDALGDDKGTIRVSTGKMLAERAYLDTLHPPGLPEGEYVYIEVSDTGCGMSPETRKRLFEPFYTTKFTGRGLGLSAVFGIVSGHGGAIELRSEPGSGATFRVLLPVPSAVVETVPDKPAPNGIWDGNGTILVVDDSEDSLVIAREVLGSAGYSVMTASDGPEGIEIYRKNSGSISAVIMDLVMPRMRGEEAAKELRKIRGDTNILFLSGYHEVKMDELIDGPGKTAVLEKPYRVATLLGAVRDIIRPA